jgi:hypothetical protein
MTVIGWVCVGLLALYWAWMLFFKKTKTTSWIVPGIVTLVLCGGIYMGMRTPPPPPVLMGGFKKWF